MSRAQIPHLYPYPHPHLHPHPHIHLHMRMRLPSMPDNPQPRPLQMPSLMVVTSMSRAQIPHLHSHPHLHLHMCMRLPTRAPCRYRCRRQYPGLNAEHRITTADEHCSSFPFFPVVGMDPFLFNSNLSGRTEATDMQCATFSVIYYLLSKLFLRYFVGDWAWDDA